jgi:hypothetical protein
MGAAARLVRLGSPHAVDKRGFKMLAETANLLELDES